MKYSDDLIEKVKRLYPTSTKMHEVAISGHEILGRYLDDSSYGGIKVETILAAKSLKEIQDIAQLQKEKKDLYRQWDKEVYPSGHF